MARYALIDKSGLIVNVILWDGVRYHPDDSPEGWTPPDDLEPVELADDNRAGPGAVIDRKGNVLEPAAVEEAPPTLEERVAAVEEVIRVNETLTATAKPVN